MAKKKKKVRVRDAKPGDVNLFRKMWLEYLTEHHEKGGHILPTEKNLDLYTEIYAQYVSGQAPGVVLFIGEHTVHMSGTPGPATFDTDFGTAATGWGTYVRPEARNNGYSKTIREAAFERLKAMGFDCVHGSALYGDESALASAKKSGIQLDGILTVYWFKE